MDERRERLCVNVVLAMEIYCTSIVSIAEQLCGNTVSRGYGISERDGGFFVNDIHCVHQRPLIAIE